MAPRSINNESFFSNKELPLKPDIDLFNNIYGGGKNEGLNSLFNYGLASSQQSNALNKKMTNVMMKAEEQMAEASTDAILQRVDTQIKSIVYESRGSSVKKTTETFKEIKF